jgi:hypothetical protein
MPRFQLLTLGFVGVRYTNSDTPPPFYFFFLSLVLYTGIETAMKTAQKTALALPF